MKTPMNCQKGAMKIHSRYTPEYTFCYYTSTACVNTRTHWYPWVRGYVAGTGAGWPLTPAGLQPTPGVRWAKTDSYWIVWYLCSVVLQEMHSNETLIVSYSYFWRPSRISRNSTGTVILWRNNQLVQHHDNGMKLRPTKTFSACGNKHAHSNSTERQPKVNSMSVTSNTYDIGLSSDAVYVRRPLTFSSSFKRYRSPV